MLRLQELKSIFIYLFQETLIAMVVRFTDPLLTILIMAKNYTIHAIKQKKRGGSPQCHIVEMPVRKAGMLEVRAFLVEYLKLKLKN